MAYIIQVGPTGLADIVYSDLTPGTAPGVFATEEEALEWAMEHVIPFQGSGGGGSDAFYGNGVDHAIGGGGDIGLAGGPVAGAAVVVSLAMLVSRYGTITGRLIWGVLQRYAVAGRVAFNRLPSWLRTALAFLGIDIGEDIILGDVPFGGPGNGVNGDGLPAIPGVPGLPAIPGLPSIPSMGLMVLKHWVAGGRPFYKLSDGTILVQKNGWFLETLSP